MIVAAPFLGEFGWEVSLWNPWLRYQARQNDSYKGHEFTVICRPESEYLYEDFAQRVIPYKPAAQTVKLDCQHVWLDGIRVDKLSYLKMAKAAIGTAPIKMSKSNAITPMDMPVSWQGQHPPIVKRASYRPFGTGEKEEGWVAIHNRFMPNKQHERDWRTIKFDAVIADLKPRHVIWVGSTDASLANSTGEDLRGLSLKETCHAISKCKVIVGPSSGPMALGLLCKTPVVWWSPNAKDVARFASHWNPFKVPQQRAAMTWDPSVRRVVEACRRFL